MTRTRRQAAQAADDDAEPRKTSDSKEKGNSNSIVLDFNVAAPSKKISKQPKNVVNSDQQKKAAPVAASNQNIKPASKGTGQRGRPPKLDKKQSQIVIEDDNSDSVYNSELVNLNLIKPFDIDAVIDQTGNSNGDSHLPRATLNQIIRESLPLDVRAQKDTMDLICFISNAFIDLLSDVSNNVCYKYKKKNIVPEHVVRGLQHLNLDQYLPFLLTDEQNITLSELLKAEKKKNAECKGEGIHQLPVKQINNAERSQATREEVVNLMMKRLQNPLISGGRGPSKKHAKKREWTEQDIRDQQKLFTNLSNGSDEDSEGYGGEGGTENESPTLANGSPLEGDPNTLVPDSAQNSNMYVEDFRVSWINHNKALLDQDYLQWAQNLVDQYVEYVAANPAEAENYITDLEKFKESYPLEYFYELQYQQYLQSQEPQAEFDGQIQPTDNQQLAVQDNQNEAQEAQQEENGINDPQIDQNQPIIEDQSKPVEEGALATTAEVTDIKAQELQFSFPQPTMTPMNSLVIDPKVEHKLDQATSNAVSYNIIQKDQKNQKPTKQAKETNEQEDEVDFDDIDD